MQGVSPRANPVRPDLAAVFDEHFDYVWNALRRLGVRQSDLEDVAQEVFLRLHKRLDDYDSTRPMRPWIFGFAYRVASDHKRLARHRVEVMGSTLEPADPARRADERLEANEQRALVEAALEAVELERRAVLVMHDLDEIPIPAVARELGIPVNTAYSRLRLAREDFVAALTRFRKSRGGT
jgi:RNA polymerase sigma-70 factor (ECF subfamily)